MQPVPPNHEPRTSIDFGLDPSIRNDVNWWEVEHERQTSAIQSLGGLDSVECLKARRDLENLRISNYASFLECSAYAGYNTLSTGASISIDPVCNWSHISHPSLGSTNTWPNDFRSIDYNEDLIISGGERWHDDQSAAKPGKNHLPPKEILTIHSLPFKIFSNILVRPDEMKSLTSLQFEELTAEILNQLGYQEIILTPSSRDGGKDIIASTMIDGIKLVFFFECKKYSDSRKVQVETLRALLGSVAHEFRNVNKGVLVTTSTFTNGAKALIKDDIRLGGRDYEGIVEWIAKLANSSI